MWRGWGSAGQRFCVECEKRERERERRGGKLCSEVTGEGGAANGAWPGSALVGEERETSSVQGGRGDRTTS